MTTFPPSTQMQSNVLFITAAAANSARAILRCRISVLRATAALPRSAPHAPNDDAYLRISRAKHRRIAIMARRRRDAYRANDQRASGVIARDTVDISRLPHHLFSRLSCVATTRHSRSCALTRGIIAAAARIIVIYAACTLTATSSFRAVSGIIVRWRRRASVEKRSGQQRVSIR